MPLPILEVAFDLGDVFVFHVFFNDLGIYTNCRGVVTAILLATLTLKTTLVLVFLTSLALLDGRLLVLATRYVNRTSISRLSLLGVFFLLFYRLVPSRRP